MKSISSKAIVAVMVSAIGLSAIAPAMAQTAPTAPDAAVTQSETTKDARSFRTHGEGPRERGGAGGFLDFRRGGEAIEIALVRLSHRVDLTAEQQTLLDALKTSALSAADTFETATEGLRPTPPAEGQTPVAPSITERLENRIALEKAHVAALEAVQPDVAAFFDSLTDEQQAQLMPEPGKGGFGPRGGHGGGHPQGPRGHGGGNH